MQRRKNRPRKPRTQSVVEPPKRRFKLPFLAPETFVSSLQPLDSLKRNEHEAALVPHQLRAEMMMDPWVYVSAVLTQGHSCNHTFLQCELLVATTLTGSDERLVIRHYLSRTVHIILAFEAPHNPWNPWLAVHAPLAFTHLPG